MTREIAGITEIKADKIYCFRIEKKVNPEVVEAIRILETICETKTVDPVRPYDSEVAFTLDGKVKTIADLRTAAQQIKNNQYKIVSITVK